MKAFIDKLIEAVDNKKSHVVVGLDPDLSKLPGEFKKQDRSLQDISHAIYEFNSAIIDSIHDLVPAVKPQIAFYERYGPAGVEAFLKTIKYGKRKGLIVIEDAKRNDIGSTAIAYSDGHLGRVEISGQKVAAFDVDAITVNPYLGYDGILPFVKDVEKYGKGVFVLVKTSNKSSMEIQDLEVMQENGKRSKVYEIVAKLVTDWGASVMGKHNYSSVGAVVGATFSEDARVLRKLMPHAYFLVPGYGAQGGCAKDVLTSFNSDGLGALISASRSIIFAYRKDQRFKEKEFSDAARQAVIEMNNDINTELRNSGLLKWS